MKILGISGSLRAASLNSRLLEAARRLLPEGAEMEIFSSLADIPLYNADIDGDAKPQAVQALQQSIAACDALLFATPEYNYSIPGVLKNAIDWASRPAFKSVLARKPAAIVSASPGPLGGVRAHAHLRDVLAGTLTPVFLAPAFVLGSAQNAFDDAGRLVDETAQQRLTRYLAEFVDWAEALAKT